MNRGLVVVAVASSSDDCAVAAAVQAGRMDSVATMHLLFSRHCQQAALDKMHAMSRDLCMLAASTWQGQGGCPM